MTSLQISMIAVMAIDKKLKKQLKKYLFMNDYVAYLTEEILKKTLIENLNN